MQILYLQVYFSGKPSSLGMKQGGKGGFGKWSELSVPKSPKITHIAAGHDGLHAVLIAEDGSVYFTGTARRGEDGDHSECPKRHIPRWMPKCQLACLVIETRLASEEHSSWRIMTLGK